MPTFEVQQERTLHCTEGGSDKLYRLQLVLQGDTFGVCAANCRRGSTWVDQGFKVQGVALDVAEKKLLKLMAEKKAKGYHEIGGFGSSEGTTVQVVTEKVDSGIRPQLLNPIQEDTAHQYLVPSAWIAQEKKDGRRLMIRKNDTQVIGINKLGQVVSLDGPLLDAMNVIDGSFIMDGEIVGGTYWVFDLLERNGTNLKPLPYSTRLHTLEAEVTPTPSIQVVTTFRTSTEKAQALASLKASGAEGMVFKKAEAPYVSGRPASGGDQVKLKFWASASFVVVAKSDKRSVSLGLYQHSPELVPMGRVTIPANQPIPEPGSILEVKYLYAFRDGKLHQPISLGLRDDIEANECTMSQLKFKNEGADADEE